MNDRSSERTYKAQNKLDANTERTSVSAKGKHIANSSEGELDSGESNGRAFHRSREISGDRKDTKVAANRQAVTTYQGTKAKKPETRRTPSVKEGRRDGKSSQSPPLTRHASDFPGHGSSPSRPTFRNSNIENRKRSDPFNNFSDESRLSKFMRRILRESDRDRRLSCVKQLRDYLQIPEGAKVAYKNAEDIYGTLHDIFFERATKDLKQDVAVCIGIVGHILGHKAQRYFQWLFNQTSHSQVDEIRILYMRALLETLTLDTKLQYSSECMPLVMNGMQTLLENADTPDLLKAVMEIILHVARHYPHVFSSHFRDTVDILVGWHIDSTQKESLTTYTSEALLSFEKFWVSDLSFSHTLLGQFLEDMEAYKEELVSATNSGEEPFVLEENLNKIYALLKVFSTVIRSLGDSISPTQGGVITKEYVIEMLHRILSCVDTAVHCLYSESLLIAANTFLHCLLSQLQGVLVMSDSLLTFLTNQACLEQQASNNYIGTLLNLIVKVIELCGTNLSVSFLSLLMKPGSRLLEIRFSQNQENLSLLMSVYNGIMGLKSVPLLQEAYRNVVGDVQSCFNQLLTNCGSTQSLNIVPDNPFAEVKYTIKKAEIVVIFNLCALAEIGNTKSNLIGMWALSPSIFDLFIQHLYPLDVALTRRFPAVHYATLHALYSHCSGHENFISSSNLLKKVITLDGSIISSMIQTTSGHFSTILTRLQQILASPHVSMDIRCLCLKWTFDVIACLQSSPSVLITPLFLSLMASLCKLGYNAEIPVTLGVCHCLKKLLTTTLSFPDKTLLKYMELCVWRVADNDDEISGEYIDLLKMLPINITMSQSDCPNDSSQTPDQDEGDVGLKAGWLARRSHVSKVPLGTFHHNNFKQVMGVILQDITPRSSMKRCGIWKKLFWKNKSTDMNRSVGRVLLPENVNRSVPKISSSSGLLWFWSVWEAAQYCVLARLRTPLGKPQDTFTTIEGVIKAYAAEIRNQANSDEDSTTRDTDSDDTLVECSKHLRVRLLLQFMESLDKLLYNAYEGCATAMPASPKTVRTFFRTNKGTCQEWLTRIRTCIITVALHCGLPAMAVRQIHCLIQDMKGNSTQGPEFDHAVLYLVEALIALECPESLQGLYKWCKETMGRRLPWIKVAVEKAYGRFENAAKEYRSVLKQLSLDSIEEADSLRCSSPEVFGILDEKITKRIQLGNVVEPDVKTTTFIVSEITDCYLQLCDWDSVLEWQENLKHYRNENVQSSMQSAYTSTKDMNYIMALAQFDKNDLAGVRNSLELIPGASLSDLSQNPSLPGITWDPRYNIEQAHAQFIRVATVLQQQTVNSNKTDLLRCLSQGKKWTETVLNVDAIEWPPLLSDSVVTELCSFDLLKKMIENNFDKDDLLPLSSMGSLDLGKHDIETMLQAIRLVNVQYQLATSEKQKSALTSQLSRLQLAAAHRARKQHNYSIAEQLLINQTSTLLRSHTEHAINSIIPAVANLKAANGGIEIIDLIQVERESAKLLHCTGQSREGIDLLSTSIMTYIQLEAKVSMCSDLCARSLLTLIKWLQTDHKTLSSLASQIRSAAKGDGIFTSSSVQNLNHLLEWERQEASCGQGVTLEEDNEGVRIGDHPILSDTDSIVGRLFHLSTIECPGLAKTWYSLAGWCYKWGRKAVDNASHGCVKLLPEEITQVTALLPRGTSPDEMDKVFSVLSQLHTPDAGEEDISDQDQSLYDDGAETTRRQLLASCVTLQVTSCDCIEALLDVWRGVVRRVYHYYQLSAKSYFTYLELNGGTNKEADYNEDGNIIATLRLLRLLVKHAWELRGVLECGLAETPTGPWRGIIPQLFSRLNHPEAYVRQSVSELLCRVAQDVPHLIVYPAVVGCSTNVQEGKEAGQDGVLNNYLTANDEDGLEGEDVTSQEEVDELALTEDPSKTILQDCLTSIVDTLSYHNPRMISEVKQFVQELRRITLLWDELWLGTLNQHHQDVTRRITQLENEVKKVTNNSSLTKEEKTAIIEEKHKTIMKPTVFTMERVREITAQAPETPHEQWFQNTFGSLIDNALDKLRNPAQPASPQVSWQLFKQLHHSLQQRAQKRSSLFLKLNEISKKLGALTQTVLPMPGFSNQGEVVTILSIHNTVQILPTKTKPKKLMFRGSNGKKYSYLFKGLEDLHLDERIMQFLSIVNNMFVSTERQGQHLYRARHYSVTPLGPRSGLIQWVDGATALFGLYKRWQQREALAQAAAKPGSTGSNSTGTNPVIISRPSEVYYGKLTPALKEKNITNLDNRKEWPLSVMKTVLEELMAETPSDLLAKELWCSSTSANEWWTIMQTYSRSAAVMSMIGYIIGLGDRHLDNVLVDLATGEVVHIDYNVCFEKGKGLRVPERVPFRMTPNIEVALGVTGVEGTFRIACEHVIKIMRKGRETLLTLLEAFVYDPLVDWTTGNEGGFTGAFYGGGPSTFTTAAGDVRQSKRDMEREITSSMFAIRVAEMKVVWIKNRDEMLGSLPCLTESIQKAIETMDEYDKVTSDIDKLRELKTMLTTALGDPAHSLYTLSHRYQEYSFVKGTRVSIETALQEKIAEYSRWQSMHQHVMQSIHSPGFQTLCSEVAAPLDLGMASFSAAAEFLQGAGQSQTVAQCEQVETDMASCLQHRRLTMHSTLDILHTYITIVTQFGVQFTDRSRSYQYLNWLQDLVCDFTAKKCSDIGEEFQSIYGAPNSQSVQTQAILNTEHKLQLIVTESKAKMVKVIDRRGQEGTDIPLLELQVKETEADIKAFVHDTEDSGTDSLMSVVTSALAALNKRYLVMEGAASAAGDRLMDLTSRDRDWFLDELCSMSGNVNHFLQLLPDCKQMDDMQYFSKLHAALTMTHNMYIALQELNANFRTIIIPEALKTIQAGEASVLVILDQLNNAVFASGQPLDVAAGALEIQHRNAVMGVKPDASDLMGRLKKLQNQFTDLLHISERDNMELSSGQMLLMGFNGLFSRLDDDFSSLLDAIDSLDVPDSWKKVDVIREAKSMQLSSFVGDARTILSMLFFVKRLQAIQDFFTMCRQFASTMQGDCGCICWDDEQLSKPVKKFIAEYVRKKIIGFPSQILAYILCVFVNELGLNVTAEIELKDIGAESKVPLDDLCKKAVDLCLRNGQFQHVHFTQASALTGTHDAAWRKHDLARRLDANTSMLQVSLQRAQLQLARYQWLHEDVFMEINHPHMIMPNRPQVMSEMRKSVKALLSHETNFLGCQERYVQLEASIDQRLKWAAGANPSLNLILKKFEETSAYRKSIYEMDVKLANELIHLCQGILHFEALRTRTPEARASEMAFCEIINRCRECCVIVENTASSVTELEEFLMASKAPEEGQLLDESWIESTIESIEADFRQANHLVSKQTRNMDNAKETVRGEVTSIRCILSTHHKLMSDIRTILKSMAKQEEQDSGCQPLLDGSICDYLAEYKSFSESVSTMLKTAAAEDMTKDRLMEVLDTVHRLRDQIPIIYDSLIKFAPPLTELKGHGEGSSASSNSSAGVKKSGDKDPALTPARKVSALLRDHGAEMPPSSPMAPATKLGTPVKKPDKISRDPRTGKAVQERNSYAVSVWRRVKMKLDGRDPDPGKRFSVAEQVDYVIKEAMNMDNLAVLYEGWTPWV